MTYTLAFVGFR